MSAVKNDLIGVISAKKMETRRSGTRLLRSPSFLAVLFAVIFLACTWSYMLFNAQTHKTLDQRVLDVASQLKCPICQGESVADSSSGLAQEMRATIRQQLQAGKSEQQVIQYFANSYGSQIIWSPPWQGFSLLAWLMPIALLLGGTLLIFFIFRAWRIADSSSATLIVGKSTVPDTLDQSDGDTAFNNMDEMEVRRYSKQLAEELAAADPLFDDYREV